MNGLIRFKYNKQQTEWDDIQLYQKVKQIVTLLAFYSWIIFKERIEITEIFRTQEENDIIYKEKGHYSVHTLHPYPPQN